MLVQPLQALLQLPAFVCVSPSIRAAAAEDAEGLRRIARRSTVVNALSGPRRFTIPGRWNLPSIARYGCLARRHARRGQ